MGFRNLVNSVVALAMNVTGDLKSTCQLTVGSVFDYDPETGTPSQTGTPLTVPALYYQKKATRPTQRPQGGLTPERVYQTQNMVLVEAAKLGGATFKKDDTVQVDGIDWTVQEIATPDPSIYILTITQP